MTLRRIAVVAVAGTLLSAIAGIGLGLGATAAIKLIAVAGGAAVGTGIAGALVVQLLRRRSITVQTALVTLTSIGAMASGLLAASGGMFHSTHPSAALAAILLIACTVGTTTAIVLGGRIAAESHALVDATRKIATGDLGARVEEPATEELAHLARELESMSTQLEQAQLRERAQDASRMALVAWVSHDLRTPLARVRAITEALDDRVAEDEDTIAAYHKTLLVETGRLGKLIDDLFELSRISAGALVLTPEPILLADLVSDVVASTAVMAKPARVTIEAVPQANPRLMVSPTHVERALTNVVDNALRHTVPGGVVRIEVGETADAGYVSVADGCGGIPIAELERLRARRSSDDPALPSAHAGLGVEIARGLVEAHGGSMSITNQPPGCCFRLELPLRLSVAAGSGSPLPTPS